MTEEIDLRSLLKLILKQKKLIIAGTLVCIVLVLALSFLIPPTYQSSLILEIGRIYLSPRGWAQELQYLEEPDATANIMSGIGILAEINRKLELGLRLKSLRKKLEVTTFIENNKFLPILEVVYEGKSPRETVDFLNTLAGIIIKRHEEKYSPYRTGLEERIRFNREKISALEQYIAAQTSYRDLTQKYIDRGEVSAEEFSSELDKLNSTDSTALNMLYLQESALREKTNLSTLTQFKAAMDMGIGQGRKEIADAEMEIADLQSRLGLSYPTRIVSPAVPIDKPVKPNRFLLVPLAAIIGFVVMIVIIAGREYLR